MINLLDIKIAFMVLIEIFRKIKILCFKQKILLFDKNKILKFIEKQC